MQKLPREELKLTLDARPKMFFWVVASATIWDIISSWPRSWRPLLSSVVLTVWACYIGWWDACLHSGHRECPEISLLRRVTCTDDTAVGTAAPWDCKTLPPGQCEGIWQRKPLWPLRDMTKICFGALCLLGLGQNAALTLMATWWGRS